MSSGRDTRLRALTALIVKQWRYLMAEDDGAYPPDDDDCLRFCEAGLDLVEARDAV